MTFGGELGLSAPYLRSQAIPEEVLCLQGTAIGLRDDFLTSILGHRTNIRILTVS